MRARLISSVGASALALVLLAALAPSATAHNSATSGHVLAKAPSPASKAKRVTTCFSNMNRKKSTGTDIPSDVYTDPNDPLNSQAADDFTLDETCMATEIDVAGTFDSDSVVDSAVVYLYRDAGGLPAHSALWAETHVHAQAGDQLGSFNLKFGPVILQPGTYWISVRIRVLSGQWGWNNTSVQVGNPAVFQNPNGGYPGCATWVPIQSCFPDSLGSDLMFKIKG